MQGDLLGVREVPEEQGGLLGGSGWSSSTMMCGRSPEDRQGRGKAISQGGAGGTTVKSGFKSPCGPSSSETLAWDLVTLGFASFSNTHPPDAFRSLPVSERPLSKSALSVSNV